MKDVKTNIFAEIAEARARIADLLLEIDDIVRIHISISSTDPACVAYKIVPQGMSINLLMENETDPVVWRGPVIAGTVKQFWTDVIWEDIDVLVVDMPPGTGDVPLTVFQSIPIDGVIVVTSPQDLVSMVVSKAVNMANMMNIRMIGVVENMSYFVCPACGEKYEIFGKSKIDTVAEEEGLEVLAKVPIDPNIAEKVDLGEVESIDGSFLSGAAEAVKAL